MDRNSTQTRTRRIIESVLIFLPGFALGASAILKFARVPGVVHQMAALGFADGKLMLVAALELLSSILFLFPQSRSLGLVFLSAFFGGVICTHVQFGEYVKAGGLQYGKHLQKPVSNVKCGSWQRRLRARRSYHDL